MSLNICLILESGRESYLLPSESTSDFIYINKIYNEDIKNLNLCIYDIYEVKYTLLYNSYEIDEKWLKIKDLYDKNELLGIIYIKCLHSEQEIIINDTHIKMKSVELYSLKEEITSIKSINNNIDVLFYKSEKATVNKKNINIISKPQQQKNFIYPEVQKINNDKILTSHDQLKLQQLISECFDIKKCEKNVILQLSCNIPALVHDVSYEFKK